MLTVGNSTAGVESLLGDGLLSCPGCGGRLGGWGHAVRRRVFTAGRLPVSVRPRRARCSSCGATHVLLPAWLLSRRCDGTAVIGDMLARAARGAGVPVDRGRVGGAGGHGAGPAAPVPVLGGQGAGVLHPAGRASWRWTRCRWTRRAVSPGTRWWRSPRRRPRPRAGGRRSRCRPGSSRPWSRWGRSCPRLSPSAWFAGMCCRLPWGDGSTRVPLCPGGVDCLSLSTGLQEQAAEKGQDVTTADEADQKDAGGAGPGDGPVPVLAGAGAPGAGAEPGGAGLAGQGAGRPCPRGAGRAAGHGVVLDADPVAQAV